MTLPRDQRHGMAPGHPYREAMRAELSRLRAERDALREALNRIRLGRIEGLQAHIDRGDWKTAFRILQVEAEDALNSTDGEAK